MPRVLVNQTGTSVGSMENPLYMSSVGSATGSLNTTVIPLSSSATFTGDWEQNDFSDVMVSCITDSPGTLYFDFSVNGTDVNTYPVNGFGVSSGIHEFHTAVKGSRYFRVRLVNDVGGQTYLRLYTYYGTYRSGHLPLNQSIGSDQDSIVTRSVVTGFKPDGVGDFVYGAEYLDGFMYSTTSNLGISGTYETGVLDICNYSQVQTCITSDEDGSLAISFCSDSSGTDVVRTITVPYTASNGFQLYAAPAFSEYVKYVYTNGITGQSDFYFASKGLTGSLSAQVLTMDAFISPSMTANLGRNVLVGQNTSGNFGNVAITGDNELLTNTFASSKQGSLTLDSGLISSTTYKLLVDKSDTASFPHNETNSISIDHISQDVTFSTGNADAEISYGLITRIDGTSSDISWLKSFFYSAANANTSRSSVVNFQPSSLVFDNNNIKGLTNDISTSVTAVNTSSTLDCPTGSLTSPALGDVIVRYTYVADSYNSNLTVLYHSD